MGWKTRGAVGVVIAWVGATFFPLLKVLRPPWAPENALPTESFHNALTDKEAFDVHVYVTGAQQLYLPSHAIPDPYLSNRTIPFFHATKPHNGETAALCARSPRANDVHHVLSIRTTYRAEKTTFGRRLLRAEHLTACNDMIIVQETPASPAPGLHHVNTPTEAQLAFRLPETLRKNETLRLVTIATKPRAAKDGYELAFHWSITPLTRVFIPEPFRRPKRFLLEDPSGTAQKRTIQHATGRPMEDLRTQHIVGLPKEVILSVVVEQRALRREDTLRDPGLMTLLAKRGQHGHVYIPPFTVDTFSSPRDESTVLVPSAPLRLCDPNAGDDDQGGRYTVRLKLHALGLGTWRLQRTMHLSISEAGRMLGEEASAYDMDSLKLMVAAGNPWLIMSTFLISFLHLVFSILAFSSDVSYWNSVSEKACEGISASSIVLDAVFSGIITLYLLDVDRSMLVLCFSLAKIGMDLWKIWKLARVTAGYTPIPSTKTTTTTTRTAEPATKRSDDTQEKEEDRKEKTVDLHELHRFETACLWKLVPLLALFVIGVMAYQLVFVPQRGWRNWCVYSLALCSYAGGFMTMTPQLFRNYKLQSVEHLAWANLTYQALNAFVDDFFSFIIRMPKMHRFGKKPKARTIWMVFRISVFRDDIIFIVYSVQRFMYAGRRKAKTE